MKPRDRKRLARLARLDRAHLWHPFTRMREHAASEPLIVERARGNWLYDASGRKYLDGVSSLWANVHGHRRPEIDRAIREQLGRVAHTTLLGAASVPAVELAAELAKLAPKGLRRVFLSDSGSEAMEVALKLAFGFRIHSGEKKRRGFIALEGGYHGDTLGAVSVGGIDLFHAAWRPLLFRARHLPAPHCYRCPLGLERPKCSLACLEEAGREIRRRAAAPTAVVMEPLVQGAGGMLVHPEGYLAGIRRATRAAGVLLILDEVATGFGRTGKMFACEHEQVSPDLMAVAKGLTGGYLPVSATLATEKIHRAFLGSQDSPAAFYHGHTYGGNQLGCAAALASLGIFKKEKTLARVRKSARLLRKLLDERIAPLDAVGDIRLRGLMGGIELVRDRKTKEPFPAQKRVGAAVCLAAREKGVLLRPLGDVLVIMPPLSLTDGETELLVDSIRHGIVSATGRPAGKKKGKSGRRKPRRRAK